MLIQPTGDAHEAVDPKPPKDGQWDDVNALRITVQDAESAEAWAESHYMSIRWVEADMMYQSPPILKTWEGTTVPRANISRFTVATHINALLAQITNGLFYEEPPFILRPRPNTSEDTVRAITAVQGAQLDSMNFRQECKRGLFSSLLFGTGVWKWGWRAYTETEKKYVRVEDAPVVDVGLGRKITVPTKRSQQFKVVETERTCSEPYFENIDIRYLLVDPGCRTGDIRDANYVIHKQALTYRDLMKLRDEQEMLGGEEYDLPGEAEIRSWFEPPEAASVAPGSDMATQVGSGPYLHHASPRFERTTADPLDEPLEILERWDNECVVTVINRSRVIRNCCNPVGCIPFYSVNWWNIPDAMWGMGLGALLACEQRIQQGLTNAAVDMASLIVNPLIVRSRGANVTSQSIRQRLGGIVDVDGDPEKAFRYQEVPEIPAEIFAQEQQSEARSEAVSGANELLTMGNMPAHGRTSVGRTATGASALSSAASSRIGAFVEDFNRQVFQPWLWQMHQLNCERLPISDLHQILNDELGEAFKVDEADYLNASLNKFEVLAGSHLAVKSQMSQAVVLMSQLFESPQIMSELAQINQQYVDVSEILHMIADMSGFKNYYSIVKKMTPQMLQQQQANNPAVQQAHAKAQLQQQKTQDQSQLIDQKDINRAVQLGIRSMLDHSVQAEENAGQSGSTSFGTQGGG